MRRATFLMSAVVLLASLAMSDAFLLLADDTDDGGNRGPKKPKKEKEPKVRYGQRGNSSVAHLYLFAKDPDTWEIIRARDRDKTWAKLKYNLNGDEFKFVLNAHGLTSGGNHSLIYYPDPWPRDEPIAFANGAVNRGGNLHLSGSVDTGDDLPIDADKNNLQNPDRYGYIDETYNGAKLWLVFSTDVDFENHRMTGWNPSGYLFEYDLMTFDYPNQKRQPTPPAFL
jgi:hypothetical protein